MNNVLPKYYVIKNDIIEKINNEKFTANQLLPSEREFIEEYDVSRITVRRAIDELVKEGYVYKIQGKGSFVKGDTLKQKLTNVHSYTEEIINHGMVPSRKILNMEIKKVDVKKMKRLNLNENDEIFILERIYYANDDPICLTKTVLPYKLFPKIECFDFVNNSLYYILENFYNLKITRASQVLEASASTTKISDNLNVEDGHPLLLFKTITYGSFDGIDVPFEYFKSYFKTDNIKYSMEQLR
ncbi:GntR family transcriptional regulator [Clostridium sp. CCUG 7971]|uniref:GntR family transcriptional regulator n=1 Tax=Clostridium sp. CCUG 7971 TaxID=2811414 RepID=UPI001ABA06B4|nr:GntR family transcriptional regulator [Clostridium sp. CCUG 7971]MBO3446073.1 GntR family transcriptional regulator [Clostridium sp. CCUG 7971]